MTPGRRDPRALILIAIGILWLVAASGFLPGSMPSGIGFYWPLLLVGIGIDLGGWRRPWRIPYTALAAALVLLGALLYPAPNGAPATTRFDAPVGTTTSASIHLTLANVATDVRSTADSASLLTARTSGWRHAVIDVAHTDPERIRLGPAAGGTAPALSFRPNRWRIGVGTAVPIALAVEMGSGPTDLDLRAVQLTSLTLDGGSGPVKAVLPDAAARYRVGVHGGSGGTTLRVASGAALELDLDTGSGPTSVRFDKLASARVTLRAGSGPVDLEVPAGAAVRVLVSDDGSGALRLGSFLERRAGTGQTGLWASSERAVAAPSIAITVARAGSGRITVR